MSNRTSNWRQTLGLGFLAMLCLGGFVYSEASSAASTRATASAAILRDRLDELVTVHGRANNVVLALSSQDFRTSRTAAVEIENHGAILLSTWTDFTKQLRVRPGTLSVSAEELGNTIDATVLLAMDAAGALRRGEGAGSFDLLERLSPLDLALTSELSAVEGTLARDYEAAIQDSRAALTRANYSFGIASGAVASLCSLLLFGLARTALGRPAAPANVLSEAGSSRGIPAWCAISVKERSGTARGFTLLESLIVTVVLTVAASVSIVQMRSSIILVDSDRACNLVSSQLQYARQVAIDQRRQVHVEFIDDNEIKVTRLDTGDETTVLSNVYLPSGFAFAMPSAPEIGDTPDAYGDSEPVDFNDGTSGTYLADGSFVDDSGIPLNGTVFTMGSGIMTSRAVTLSGATGRIHTFVLDGHTWKEKN